ncbi:MAG: complex I NDUFA9 subunit family protein [Betaproteobacteria bacterium]|nr:complex I NDUFA9 subunit family protein [Betaproteobacteria bacterium]
MNIKNVCVLGGSGFVGRHIVHQLAQADCRVRVLTRRRERAKGLIVLPTVEVVEANVFDAQDLARQFTGMDAVINLIGILHGGSGGRPERARSFEEVHVELPRRVVAACLGEGVPRLLHMSALGADRGGPSAYQRTKGAGEALVLEAGRIPREDGRSVAVTVFRPSVIFGPEDTFLNLFARLVRLFPVVPLANAKARFQPIYVEDVARAYVASLGEPRTFGQAYDLCGPASYSLEALVAFVARLVGSHARIVPLGPRLSYLQALALEFMPGRKLMTRDNFYSLQTDNVCAGSFPSIFGFDPMPLEAVAPRYLRQGMAGGRYDGFRRKARR